MNKKSHELQIGMSLYWVKTWPATIEGSDGYHWSGSGGRVGGWTAGTRADALKEAREAYAAREALQRIAARPETKGAK